MRKLLIILLLAVSSMISACSQEQTAPAEPKDTKGNLVFVEGGAFINTKSNYYGKNVAMANFYIGKYEVTQKEWVDVMGSNPSQFRGDNLPVETVSWYDAVEYCNQRSIKEGLDPYYKIDKDTQDPNNMSGNDTLRWTVTINSGVNGYRLPTEAEWEYAAGGGQKSKSYIYSGSNNADEVAWYWRNAGDQYLTGDWNWTVIESNKNSPKAVGAQKSNELGIYDMSGNVREWCWNWYADGDLNSSSGSLRVVKGGGWIGGVSNNEPAFRGKFEANGIGPDQGFRVVRGE